MEAERDRHQPNVVLVTAEEASEVSTDEPLLAAEGGAAITSRGCSEDGKEESTHQDEDGEGLEDEEGAREELEEPEEEAALPLWRRLLMALVRLSPFIAMFVVAGGVIYVLIRSGYMEQFLEFVQSLGWLGNVLLVLAVVFFNLPLPLGFAVCGVACGYLYGWVVGTLTMTIGVAIGICVAWALCGMFRERLQVSAYVHSGNPRVSAVVRHLSSHQWKLAILVRFIPIPIGVQSGILAVSTIQFWPHYIVGSMIGLSRRILTLTYMGITLKDLSEITSGASMSWPQAISFVVGMVGMVLITVFSVVVGRRALREADEEMRAREGLVASEVEMELEELESVLVVGESESETPSIAPSLDVVEEASENDEEDERLEESTEEDEAPAVVKEDVLRMAKEEKGRCSEEETPTEIEQRGSTDGVQ